MKRKLATTLLVVAATVPATFSSVATTTRPAMAAGGPGTSWPIVGYGPSRPDRQRDSEVGRAAAPHDPENPRITGPTVTARAIGILHPATYDAWAAYDPVAVDTRQRLRHDTTLRRPPAERTTPNKEKAISYAAYRVLLNLFPSLSRASSAVT